mgnify:CR=1 FL=1
MTTTSSSVCMAIVKISPPSEISKEVNDAKAG